MRVFTAREYPKGTRKSVLMALAVRATGVVYADGSGGVDWSVGGFSFSSTGAGDGFLLSFANDARPSEGAVRSSETRKTSLSTLGLNSRVLPIARRGGFRVCSHPLV